MTKMKLISSKADHLLLCVFFSLLWIVTDCTTTSPISTITKQSSASKRSSSTRSQTTTPKVTTPKPKPQNPDGFKATEQNETSITLQWNKVEGISNYRLEYKETSKEITASADAIIHHAITGLTSANRYNITLFSVQSDVLSHGTSITAVTAPINAETFAHIDQNETSITLTWNPVEGISYYILEFDGKQENITEPLTGTINHVVPNLTNGTRYEFRLFTVFDYARSSGNNITAVTAPVNAENFTQEAQNENSITLTWKRVKDISIYTLWKDGKEEMNITNSTEIITHNVTNLNPGTKYEFSLVTVFEYARSNGTDITAFTVPSRVDLVNVTERTENSIRLEWSNANENWSYRLELNGSDVSRSSTTETLTGLLPGTKYVVSVITEFSGFSSAAFDVETVTKINCDAANWQVTNSTITGTVEGLFSSADAIPKEQLTNGAANASITGRDVVFTGLCSGATYNISLYYEMASKHLLQCSHSLTLIPPTLNPQCKHRGGYSVRVSWTNVPGVWTFLEYNITGRNTDKVPKDQTEFQINQLQPAKTYKGYLVSVSGTTRSPVVEFYCSTDSAGVIAGSLFGVLCFILLVGLVAFIYIRKPDILRGKKSLIGGSKQHSAKGKNISVAKFPDHFHQLSLDDNRGFSQEYEDLSAVGTEQTRRAALLPDNKVKNRFTNVLPYDWCRVKLITSGSSETLDYINASYMPGYTTNREYIATQGPLPGTVKDFWRMIWEQKVKRIAMVTNCVEGGRSKCERYWPENGNPGLYGGISVTVRSEKRETSWTLRDFSVKHMKTSEERTVKHFHFTAWPDHGVPENTDVLIQFRGLIRQHINSEGSNEPTVVHCSAGVGRTGTLIALDVLLQQLGKEQAVDIKYFVRKMRLNRPYMVQTESQYVFLHQCIMDSLTPNNNLDENFYENVGAVYVNATALRELSAAQGKHTN